MTTFQLPDNSSATVRIHPDGTATVDRFIVTPPDTAGHTFRQWSGRATVNTGDGAIVAVDGDFPGNILQAAVAICLTQHPSEQ